MGASDRGDGHCEGISTSMGTGMASIMMYRLISLYWVGGGEVRQEQMEFLCWGAEGSWLRTSNGVLKF